jgi:hypothetical protein
MRTSRLRRAGSHLLSAFRFFSSRVCKHIMLALESSKIREIEAPVVGCLRDGRKGDLPPSHSRA